MAAMSRSCHSMVLITLSADSRQPHCDCCRISGPTPKKRPEIDTLDAQGEVITRYNLDNQSSEYARDIVHTCPRYPEFVPKSVPRNDHYNYFFLICQPLAWL